MRLVADQKYSVSMDDLAASDQGHHNAVHLDQALSCSDIPGSSGAAILKHPSLFPPPFSPPVIRHNTQPSLLQQDSSMTPEEEASTTAVSLAKTSWQRTKETYKSGLYAHWWLNASLQPIWEEPAFHTETSF